MSCRERQNPQPGEMGEEAIRTVKRWLEFLVAKSKTEAAASANVWLGGFFHTLIQSGLTVSRAETGHAFFSFRVPAHLADKDGNWDVGAIAALIDDVGAATIASVEGRIKVSVDFDVSYFSLAKIDEEVEIEARVVGHRGRLSAVVIEVRKKGSWEMVALARLWMSAARAIHHSKL